MASYTDDFLIIIIQKWTSASGTGPTTLTGIVIISTYSFTIRSKLIISNLLYVLYMYADAIKI